MELDFKVVIHRDRQEVWTVASGELYARWPLDDLLKDKMLWI